MKVTYCCPSESVRRGNRLEVGLNMKERYNSTTARTSEFDESTEKKSKGERLQQLRK